MSSDNLEFTKAIPEHAGELTALVNSVYRGENSKKGWTTEADILGGIRITEEKIRDIINTDNNIIIICISNEKIIGCVHVAFESDHCYWGMLSVDVNYQTKGIGKLLINKAEEYAKIEYRCSEVRIKVLSVRQELLDYYHRRGYNITGKKEKFEGPDVFGDAKVSGLYFVTLNKYL